MDILIAYYCLFILTDSWYILFCKQLFLWQALWYTHHSNSKHMFVEAAPEPELLTLTIL